jgi:endogenous inhibitor of DNA gyrase (YacG/DUF329 family)
VGKIVKARISPCPECGENGWWLDIEPEVELSDEEKRRRRVAAALYEEADRIRRNRGIAGFFAGPIRRVTGREDVPYEEPTSPYHVRCATCGHEMSLGQSGNEADPQHDWRAI